MLVVANRVGALCRLGGGYMDAIDRRAVKADYALCPSTIDNRPRIPTMKRGTA